MVDDDVEQLALVRRMLQAHRFEVRTTSSPIGVSNIARQFSPNIILIDVNQPALSGGQILKLLRSNTKSAAKLILFSSAGAEELRSVARQVSADGWIQKGMLGAEMAKKLRKMAEG
ncbi:MAG: response regulator [Sandaracinaceae bacterium]